MKTEEEIMRKGDFLELWDSLVPTVMKNNFRKDVDKLIQQSTTSHLEELLKLRSENETLKQQVGEGWNHDIDIAYLTGVFNVVGLDGLGVEIERLKKIGKQPHDIFDAFRELPAPFIPEK